MTKLLKILGILGLCMEMLMVRVEGACDRRPTDTDAEALPPDNTFLLDVDNIRENKYLPGQVSKVRLFARDKSATFTAFTISLKGDTEYNKDNPRKPLSLSAGSLKPYPNSDSVIVHPDCNDTVMQKDKTRKNFVEAMWTAPGKNQKCVMIYAVVAVTDSVWYSFEGPLSRRICEDVRKTEDMLPVENNNCRVCEHARYQLIFEGLWQYNTHQNMYPSTQAVARFSDLVGASHSKHKSIFQLYSEASKGLKMLAEQGNTTTMEIEIQRDLGSSVRTVIKATAPPEPDARTVTSFRVTKEHHLVSLVTGILPSPDWFLGVADMELCDAETNKWAENILYNLYPLDAGTDSGKTFEASNEVTSPPQPIRPAAIASTPASAPKVSTKPFARLILQLVRTYFNPDCAAAESIVTEYRGTTDNEEGNTEKDEVNPDKDESFTSPATTTTSEEPVSIDPESVCPMTAWSDWQECQGDCIENKLEGFQLRLRNHYGDPTPECLETQSLSESQVCSETCEEPTETDDYQEEE